MSAPVTGPEQRARGLARALGERLTDPQRAQLGAWARRLLEIRGARELPPRKAWRALDATSDAVAALLADAGRGLVELAWTDRGWPARVGFAAGGAAVAAVAGAGAGALAAGSALAVPLWVVFGGGASVARLLAEELAPDEPSAAGDGSGSARRGASSVGDEGPTVDGEWEWDAPRLAASSRARQPRPEEPLWRVFGDAYRDARARRRAPDGSVSPPP